MSLMTVRLVPKNWEHPKGINPAYCLDACRDFLSLWNCKGVPKPKKIAHYQMYISNYGIPISPVMENPEELAHWLADNDINTSLPGYPWHIPATYEQWLKICRKPQRPGWCFINGRGFMTGLEIEDETDIRVANFRRKHNI